MPAITVPVPKLDTDPGFLYYAPLGTALPTGTVAGSVFSDTWPVAWVPIGATEEGHNFTWTTSTEPIEAAEFLEPLKYVTTGRSGSIAFASTNIDALMVKLAMNGGTLTTTGTGATAKTVYTPPAMGAEVRVMIGWESQDATQRLIARQCFNTGSVSIARRKGAAKATIPVEFALEVPAGAQPFELQFAGARA